MANGEVGIKVGLFVRSLDPPLSNSFSSMVLKISPEMIVLFIVSPSSEWHVWYYLLLAATTIGDNRRRRIRRIHAPWHEISCLIYDAYFAFGCRATPFSYFVPPVSLGRFMIPLRMVVISLSGKILPIARYVSAVGFTSNWVHPFVHLLVRKPSRLNRVGALVLNKYRIKYKFVYYHNMCCFLWESCLWCSGQPTVSVNRM